MYRANGSSFATGKFRSMPSSTTTIGIRTTGSLTPRLPQPRSRPREDACDEPAFLGIRKPRVEGAHADYANTHGWAIPAPFGTDLRSNQDARTWWWNNQLPLLKDGVDGWWNDEAEQAYDEFFYMSQQQYLGGRAVSQIGSGPSIGLLPPGYSTMAPQRGPAISIQLGRSSVSNQEHFLTGAWKACRGSPMIPAVSKAHPRRNSTRVGLKRPSSPHHAGARYPRLTAVALGLR